MLKIVTVIVAVIGFGTQVARAQAPTAPPPAVLAAPAPPAPSLLTSDADALTQRGLHQRRTGAILMGVGGGVLLAGAALTIAGFVGSSNDAGTRVALLGSGISAGVIGGITLLVGVPTFVVGQHKVDRAARWRMTALGAAPLAHGNGALASASFTY